MLRCLILAENPAMAAGLRQHLISRGKVSDEHIAVLVVDESPISTEISNKFHALSDWIEAELPKCLNHQNVPDVMVLTDLAGYGDAKLANLNPIKQHGWATVLGMLILSFPEIHWVMTVQCTPKTSHGWVDDKRGGLKACDLRFGVTPDDLENVLSLNRTGYSSLFDAAALRNDIRETMRSDFEVPLPIRPALAVAVDDEAGYAYLHAYTAYRFGFRSHVITTMGGMEAFLRTPIAEESQAAEALDLSKASQPTLVFEDVFLNFPDRHEDNFSHLKKRDEEFSLLANADYRILVTSGHHLGQDEEARTENPNYLSDLRARGQWNKEIGKPLGGIFNLWADSKLESKLLGGSRRGLAPEFVWPLKFPITTTTGGHSAPGRLLTIADRLIARSERLLAVVQSVPQAVYGATLATDAVELLAGRTPTTSLEAMALKHQFEVLAECQFVGTSQHMDVNRRTDDIQREVLALSDWFGSTKRQKNTASWNAELAILNKLIKVFQDNNQFDEEQTLMVRARQLHRKLRFANYWFPIRALQVFPWYVEKLVASFPLFLGCIAMWILLLGGLFAWRSSAAWHHGIADAYATFLSIQPPDDPAVWKVEDGWNWGFSIIAVTIGLGFLHLGILISHIYSFISRK
jgi:hypothetical protein